MLRKLLCASALLCLVPFSSAAAQSIPVRSPAQDRLLFAPYGDFNGAWVSATLFMDGIVAGVLTDAVGQPLWMLDAKLTDSNGIQGALFALEYAGNPVLAFNELSVMGNAFVDTDGTNRFQIVIFDAKLDVATLNQKPLYPVGYIEGELRDGRSDAPAPGLASGMAPTGASFGIAQVTSTHTLPAAGQDPAGVISCPWGGPIVVQPFGTGLVTATHDPAAAGKNPGGVISCPAGGSLTCAQAHGTLGSLGHTAPLQGSGKVTGRWYLID